MIIDCHGHYTTEPGKLGLFRNQQLAALADGNRKPATTDLGITDDEIRVSIEGAQKKQQIERGTDMTIFSPRAAGMAHHVGPGVGQPGMDADVQRPRLSRDGVVQGELHRRLPAAAVAGRVAGQLGQGAGALRDGARLRRLQSQSRSVGRLLEGSAADRSLLVSDLREDVRARRARDGARVVLVQSGGPCDRRTLHQRRHDRVHAADPERPEAVQGLSQAAPDHPAWRRRGAVPLGPLSRSRAGHEASRRSRSG